MCIRLNLKCGNFVDKILSQMKNLIKFTACILLTGFGFVHVHGQELASLSTGGYPEAKAANDKPAAPAAAGTVINITLKNSSERPMVVFAGAKEEIRNPKVQTYGGMSKNMLYLQPTDVVCLMTTDYKPTACTNIKPGATTIEINTSGNAITSK